LLSVDLLGDLVRYDAVGRRSRSLVVQKNLYYLYNTTELFGRRRAGQPAVSWTTGYWCSRSPQQASCSNPYWTVSFCWEY